jgi:hypothetical protein
MNLKKGDLITFSEAATTTYSVSADVNIGASATANITIYHGLKTDLTVASVVAIATGSGTGRVNICGDMAGFTLANRLPAQNAFGQDFLGTHFPLIDPITGIVLVLAAYAGYNQASWEIVGLWGKALSDERRITRAWSGN